MKYYAVFILFFGTCGIGLCQSAEFDSLLNLGKMEFNKEFEFQDYDRAAQLFEQALLINPNHAELLYFLGYTYSRLNSKDGKTLIETDEEMTEISSKFLEKSILLQPKYEGQLLLLDPYSKITAEWSSLAFKHLYDGDILSAQNTFMEGKKRGGFGDYFLEIARKTLNECNVNSILVCSGDNITFPLMYLQTVENYRTDVTLVDVNILNTEWYPSFLVQQHHLAFDLTLDSIDTIGYIEWRGSTIVIDKFSWDLNEGSYDGYLSRGDQILLSMIRENIFKRDIYFSPFMYSANKLDLHLYLDSQPLIEKILTSKAETGSHRQFIEAIEPILKDSHLINSNSQDEIKTLDFFRYLMMNRIISITDPVFDDDGRMLWQMLETNCPDSAFPFGQQEGREYYYFLKSQF